MKKTLLVLLFLGTAITQAQTTHNLDWRIGIGTNLNLTILPGDTVLWTWSDAFPHTITSKAGSAETFNSGTLTGNGSSYSKTFNTVGTNPYQCNFHPLSMAGNITVQTSLGIEDFKQKGLSISPNPSDSFINLELPNNIKIDEIKIFDALGKQIYKSNQFKKNIDVTNWAKGVYILKVTSEGITRTKKILKK